MSVLTDLIYGGSNTITGLAESAINEAVVKYGADREISFPGTAYFFPIIYAATGIKVKTLGDLPACIVALKGLITNRAELAQALNAGLAAVMGAEILEGLKYAENSDPYAGERGCGFVPDDAIRALGAPLISGKIPGAAIVFGRADNAADAARIVRDYLSRGVLTFLVGGDMARCMGGDAKAEPEPHIVLLGQDVTAVVHALSAAIRTALIFGGVRPGNLAALLEYTALRIPAFVNIFGAVDSVTVSVVAGAIALGFPVIVDMDLENNQAPGLLESVCDHAKTVEKSLALRGIRDGAGSASTAAGASLSANGFPV